MTSAEYRSYMVNRYKRIDTERTHRRLAYQLEKELKRSERQYLEKEYKAAHNHRVGFGYAKHLVSSFNLPSLSSLNIGNIFEAIVLFMISLFVVRTIFWGVDSPNFASTSFANILYILENISVGDFFANINGWIKDLPTWLTFLKPFAFLISLIFEILAVLQILFVSLITLLFNVPV